MIRPNKGKFERGPSIQSLVNFMNIQTTPFFQPFSLSWWYTLSDLSFGEQVALMWSGVYNPSVTSPTRHTEGPSRGIGR